MLIMERLEPIHLDDRFTMRTHDACSVAVQNFAPTWLSMQITLDSSGNEGPRAQTCSAAPQEIEQAQALADLIRPFLQEDTPRAEWLAGSGTITYDFKISDVYGISEAFEPEGKLNALKSRAVTLR
ncbi:hypothetical protein PPGU19_087110 (plasmid) [Paraburkholderia sp. PGU19]|uniref:hypothetical protein n=1 Tax=Paraburkholderia sp. PGU19 TaxID=2735434 RepID=UPI0015DBCE6C|nr:hypothetical protein [Paraburkholderia sp. PGU19]BCG04143.1 hypothetical protein PPGU19_087110 [Paraburkholderia sp. PGU19]